MMAEDAPAHRLILDSTGLSAAEETLRTVALTHELTVLPREMSAGGLALYDDVVIDLVKTLRSQGVDATYAHGPDDRSWIGEKSADLIVALIVGVASNAAWAGLAHLARARKSRPLLVKATEVTEPDGTKRQWHEFSGTGEDVAKAIEAFRRREIE